MDISLQLRGRIKRVAGIVVKLCIQDTNVQPNNQLVGLAEDWDTGENFVEVKITITTITTDNKRQQH